MEMKMERWLLCISLILVVYGALPVAAVESGKYASLSNPVRISYPAENQRIPAIPSTFVGGSAPPDGKLTINGKPVNIHPEGGFLTTVSLTPGVFEIHAELQWNGVTYRSVRKVIVAEVQQTPPVSPLTIQSVAPQEDQALLPGDWVKVVCKGSPGMAAYFTITGIEMQFPMLESPRGSGVYQGLFKLGSFDFLYQAAIRVTLMDENGGLVTKEAKGRVSRFSEDLPVIVETVSDQTLLYAGPAVSTSDKAGYVMFLPKKTMLQVTGKKGKEYRVRLNGTQTAWVNESAVKQLPAGTLIPMNIIGNVTLRTRGNSTLIRIPVAQRIPFRIDYDGDGRIFDIILYGAYSNTDWVNNAVAGCIQQVRWYQDDAETYRLRLFMEPNSWWGYDVSYEGSELVVEIRTPPPLINASLPLSGLVIAVDAGHGAGGGAMGVTGYAEGDANMAIALRLKEKLETRGAQVVMIREGDEDVPLSQRAGIAWKNRADILVSIHNNSLGPTGNPFVKRGYGVYYFTPVSLPLAREIHQAYQRMFGPGQAFPLKDDGLYHANLSVIRGTQMPSVLTESAYMIVPEEEAYLKNDAFRSNVAEAIITGLEQYAARMRKKME
ncbi:MAG TPA: N-acetylmuramoyl-L-alanine amidase [Bacillota bacterium]|nr:N-acetylmuramoyl-L-alanine amidase [Bacillota bacterium]